MSAFDLAIAIIKKWEGCELKAYLCPAKVWTIGYGETLNVKEGDVWTQAQAESALNRRAQEFLDDVQACLPDETDPHRLAACTSLAYNIGVGAFKKSSVRKLMLRKEYRAAADAFLMWNKAGGRVLKGLENRRRDEREMFMQGAS